MWPFRARSRWRARFGAGIGPSSRVRFNSQTLNCFLTRCHPCRIEPQPARECSSTVVKTFAEFEFDDRRRRLCAHGKPVRISGQTLELLCLLLDQPGELITREQIEHRLWPDRTVAFDHSLDVVVSRLRTVLGDRGPSPRYIETVPRRGYRFIEPVTTRIEARPASAARYWRRPLVTYAAVAILAAIVAILFARTRYDRFVPSRLPHSTTASARER